MRSRATPAAAFPQPAATPPCPRARAARLGAQEQHLLREAEAHRRTQHAYALAATACLLAVPSVMVGSAHAMVSQVRAHGGVGRRTAMMLPVGFAASHVLADRTEAFAARALHAGARAQPLEQLAADIDEEMASAGGARCATVAATRSQFDIER